MKALLRISSDIITKAPRTRARFSRRLAENLRAALARRSIPARLTRDHVRFYLGSDDPRAFDVARRVFGVHSLSPCLEEPLTDLDGLVEQGERLFTEQVRGRRFAVRAKVRGPEFGSMDVNRVLGARLAQCGKVDLTDPEVTVQVEVRGGNVRWFTDVLPGPGGLPVGVEGRAVVLLSGGFDSAVAAWLALRRGTGVDFVFCRLGGVAHERAVLRVANFLATEWSSGFRSRLYAIPFEALAERIVSRVREPLRQLVLKRLMFAAAEAVGRMVHAEAVITGEALGQVSSQTLKNLRALGGLETMPLLRPLLGLTKEEIIDRARQIGTHDLCSGVPEYCALTPRRPATASRKSILDAEMAAVPFDGEEAAHMAVRHVLPAPLPDETAEGEVERPPEGAVVLDIRPLPAFEAGHLPGARLYDPGASGPEFEDLDPESTYVVVCEYGLRSAWLARHLRELGFEAFNLRGGYQDPNS